MRRPQIVPDLVAAGMVLAATATLPYGYYTALRWVVTIAALITAFVAFTSGHPGWVLAGWLYVGLAILFNPFQPVGLARSTWLWIDLAAGALLLLGCIPQRQETEVLSR